MENKKQFNEKKLDAYRAALYSMLKLNLKDEFVSVIANEYLLLYKSMTTCKEPPVFQSFKVGEPVDEK